MIDKLQGCDKATIDGVLEDGTTLEQMEAGYQIMCPDEASPPPEGGCNIAGVMQCMPSSSDGSSDASEICR